CLAIGALWYFTTQHEPDLTKLVLATATCAALATLFHARPTIRALILGLGIVGVGVLTAKFETWRADTPMLGAEITTIATARVVRIEHQASGRARLTLDLLATKRPALRYAPERV